jgi:zinc protease
MSKLHRAASTRRFRHLSFVLALGCAGSQAPSSTPATSSSSASRATPGAASLPTPAAHANAVSSPALPFDQRVTRGTLSNGLTYLLQRQKSKDQRAYLTLVVKAGSLNEDDDQRGFAHLTEHMGFRGTTHFEKRALLDFFEKSGIQFGPDINAFTSYDATRYELSVPTDQPELLLRGLDALSDWADGMTFDPAELEKERSVVLAELTRALGVGRRMREQATAVLLAGSRYVDREVLGDRAVLEKGPRQRLVDFYRRWYHPERMAVVVAGDIDPAAVQSAIEQRFGALARGKEPLPGPEYPVAIGTNPSAAVLTDSELSASVVSLTLKTPPLIARTEADLREQSLSRLTAGMLGRRLNEAVQSPSAPFTEAGCEYVPYRGNQQIAVMRVWVQSKRGRLPDSLDALLTEVERVKRHGFTSTELERMLSGVYSAVEHRVAAQHTLEARAVADNLAESFVTGQVLTAPEFDLDFYQRVVSKVGLAELNRAATSALSVGEPVVIAAGVSRDALPEQPALLGALSVAARKPVEPYADKLAQGELMAELPHPGSIVKEQHIDEIDTTVWTLSNGAVVVLKPTDFKDDEILEQAISFGGNVRAPDSAYASVRFANEIVAAGGLADFDRVSLGKLLTGKQVGAYPWIGEQDEGIRGRAAPEDAETLFQLIHLYATAPRRDEATFEAFRANLRENLRNRDLVPGLVFSDATAKKVWGNSPRRLPPTLKNVDQIDLDTAVKFYGERFRDMSDFSFVFVGKIDVGKFKPLVERYLASLPGGGRKEKPRDIGLHRRKGITRVSVQAGKEDRASFALTFHGESPWSENAHTDLYELGEYLQLRLREVLREEMGGTYAPQVSSRFERVPFAAYSLGISFECKTKDLEQLERATRRVIAETKKSGVPDSYLEKLRSARTRGLEQSYRSNGFWLERLVDKYKLHEDPRQILILKQLTQRVTSDNLRAAARKFLPDDQYIEAKLTPAPEAPVTAAPSKPTAPSPAPQRPPPVAQPAAAR